MTTTLTHPVLRNILRSIGSPDNSPLMVAREWVVAMAYSNEEYGRSWGLHKPSVKLKRQDRSCDYHVTCHVTNILSHTGCTPKRSNESSVSVPVLSKHTNFTLPHNVTLDTKNRCTILGLDGLNLPLWTDTVYLILAQSSEGIYSADSESSWQCRRNYDCYYIKCT